MVTVYFRFAIVLVLLVGDKWMSGVESARDRKLFISVYYESKDSHCQSFILEQLQPAMRLLHEHISLRFVPFGRSKSIREGLAGFVCQHGPEMCMGNIVQDCALRSMTSRSDMEKLAYVMCEMMTNAASREDLECVVKADLSPDTIQFCSMSVDGIQMQLSSEYLTNLISPKTFPTITVDGDQYVKVPSLVFTRPHLHSNFCDAILNPYCMLQNIFQVQTGMTHNLLDLDDILEHAVFDQEIQDNALEDLTGTLCSILGDNAKCAQYYNEVALYHILKYPTVKTFE